MIRGTKDIVDEAVEAFASYRGLGKDIINDLIRSLIDARNQVANMALANAEMASKCVVAQKISEVTAKQIETDLNEWAARMTYIGESVPDFWDETNTSSRLAEWLTHRGYRKLAGIDPP